MREFRGDIFEFLENRKLESLHTLERQKSAEREEVRSMSQNKLNYQQSKERERELRKLRGAVERAENEIERIEKELALRDDLLAQASPATNEPGFYEAYQSLKDEQAKWLEQWEEATVALDDFQNSKA